MVKCLFLAHFSTAVRCMSTRTMDVLRASFQSLAFYFLKK